MVLLQLMMCTYNVTIVIVSRICVICIGLNMKRKRKCENVNNDPKNLNNVFISNDENSNLRLTSKRQYLESFLCTMVSSHLAPILVFSNIGFMMVCKKGVFTIA